MHFLTVLCCGCLCLGGGQSPNDLLEKAPPDIDQALRARVNRFFQTYVDGNYSDAFDTVAKESRNTYFGADKYTCKQFEVVKINYSEKFTRATAVVACDSELLVAGQRVPTKIPITSFWKTIDGVWYWYTVPRTEQTTPWGIMKPGPPRPGQQEPMATTLPSQMPTLEDIVRMVTIDKNDVRLSSYEPASDVVTVTNNMPGQISLSLDHLPMAGFTAKLDRTTLKAHESAKITLECKPEDKAAKRALDVYVKVAPLNHSLPIHVIFAIPPEIEKMLPK
jgi:hypothetical protein